MKNTFIKSKAPHKGQLVIPQQQKDREDNRTLNSPNKKIEKSPRSTSILWYIPKSRTKEGKSPFVECDMTLIKNLDRPTLPLTKLAALKPLKPPLEGSIKPSQSRKVKHENFPTKHTNPKGFDPNAYKLLAKACFNQQNLVIIGKHPILVAEEKSQRITKTQKMLTKKWYKIKNLRAILGFISTSSHILIKRESTHHIKAKVNNKECDLTLSTRQSIFDQISESSIRVSVFDKLGQQFLLPKTHQAQFILSQGLNWARKRLTKKNHLNLKDFDEHKI